jgi:hypothetical protein
MLPTLRTTDLDATVLTALGIVTGLREKVNGKCKNVFDCACVIVIVIVCLCVYVCVRERESN